MFLLARMLLTILLVSFISMMVDGIIINSAIEIARNREIRVIHTAMVRFLIFLSKNSTTGFMKYASNSAIANGNKTMLKCFSSQMLAANIPAAKIIFTKVSNVYGFWSNIFIPFSLSLVMLNLVQHLCHTVILRLRRRISINLRSFAPMLALARAGRPDLRRDALLRMTRLVQGDRFLKKRENVFFPHIPDTLVNSKKNKKYQSIFFISILHLMKSCILL